MYSRNICEVIFIAPDQGWHTFVVKTLSRIGVKTKMLSNIEELVDVQQRLRQNRQIVFVDIDYAKNEFDLFNELLEDNDFYIILIYSTDISLREMSQMFKLGVHDCVEKPFDSRSLITTVEQFLREICKPATNKIRSSESNHLSHVLEGGR